MSIKERAEEVTTDLLDLTNEMSALVAYLLGDDVAAGWQGHVASFAANLVAFAESLDKKADN
jgi:hypothetical protein